MPSTDPRNANLACLLADTAAAHCARAAVALGNRVIADYRTLASRSARLAASFIRAGLEPGDRVALISQNLPAYIETLFACWWAGLAAVPVNAKLHVKELGFVLENSGARWVFVDSAWRRSLSSDALPTALERVVDFESHEYEDLVSTADEAPIVETSADEIAWLFYTSGTTGLPKGVMITHANLRAMAQCFVSDVEPIAPGDAILHPAPLSHGSGLYVIPHVALGAVHVVPESRGFDPQEIGALLDTWNRSLFFAAPTMVKRLVAAGVLHGARLERLKCIVYGGGPMYVEDCRSAYAALGPRLAQIYGQGETPMTITAMNRARLREALERDDAPRIASVGIAQTGIEVRIGGEDDAPLAQGEVGEVLVRGPTVMPGYWRNPEASAATLAHGWLHTGDIGAMDAEGFLTLKDRSKDVIISGGSNIYPREVEEALLKHPDVAEVAIIGRRHDEWGEEVVACVVARTPLGTDAARTALIASLDAVCLEHIARFKRPRDYVFLDALPKNNAGKVLKTELRARVSG